MPTKPLMDKITGYLNAINQLEKLLSYICVVIALLGRSKSNSKGSLNVSSKQPVLLRVAINNLTTNA